MFQEALHSPMPISPRSGAPAVRALIISESPDSADSISEAFRRGGVNAVCVDTERAELALRSEEFDFVVFDDDFRSGSLASFCVALSSLTTIPVMVVSGSNESIDKVVALEAGADELISKPFHDRELLARARSLVRRSHSAALAPVGTRSTKGILNLLNRTLTGPQGARASLTPNQAAILYLWVSRPDHILSPENVMDIPSIKGIEKGYVRTSITRLRVKMVQAGFPDDAIATVRSQGYVLDASVDIKVEPAIVLPEDVSPERH